MKFWYYTCMVLTIIFASLAIGPLLSAKFFGTSVSWPFVAGTTVVGVVCAIVFDELRVRMYKRQRKE